MSSDEEPDDDEPLDPRIQAELEKLNRASMLINQLEVAVDDARATWRQLLSESSYNLDALSKKLGSCVDKAKPYYDAFAKALDAQVQVQKAAARFERAIGMQAAAREMVDLAEQSHVACSGRKQQSVSSTSVICLDTSALEVLNHATLKVMQAESDRLDCEVEHKRLSSVFKEEQERANALAKDLKKQIAKSKPYYDELHRVQKNLEEQKSVVEKLERDVVAAKGMYNKALQRLEAISNDIHLKRQQASAANKLGQRSQGVGSDAPPPPADAAAGRESTALPSDTTSQSGVSSQRRTSKDETDSSTGGCFLEFRNSTGEVAANGESPCAAEPAASPVFNCSVAAAETAANSRITGSAVSDSFSSDSHVEARFIYVVGDNNGDISIISESAGAAITLGVVKIDTALPSLVDDRVVTTSNGVRCSDEEEKLAAAADAPAGSISDNCTGSSLPPSLAVCDFQTATCAAGATSVSAAAQGGTDSVARSDPTDAAPALSKHVGLPRWASESDHHHTAAAATMATVQRHPHFTRSFDGTYDQDTGRHHQPQPPSVDRRGSALKRTSFDQLPPPLAHLQQHYNHQQRASLSDPEMSADLARIMARLLSEDDASLV